MAKSKTTFFCRNCGFESPKWAGKCASCGEWNTFVEEKITKTGGGNWSKADFQIHQPKKIIDIQAGNSPRQVLSDTELNQVLGAGLVDGSVILLGGEPGIGKSTLLLQVAVQSRLNALYISGEESEEQIKLRCDRIGSDGSDCAIVTETRLENIIEIARNYQPGFMVVDSIQTLYSDTVDSTPGSVVQIRECAAGLLRFAKESGTPVFLIGHITKDGSIAGPKLLEHMVDTVLQFEGDRQHAFRVLRVLKNRFGSTQEMGIYSMTGKGLEIVKNSGEILLAQRDEQLSGIAISCALEGTRPLLLEVQSLVSSAVYGTPQRACTGFDLRRLNMLLAVLEKRSGFKLAHHDVFVNIAGGIRLEDPAIDLGVISAIMSSYLGIVLPQKYVFAAEVGLSGEIRAIQKVEQRIIEAEKLGFSDIIISKYNKIPEQKRKIAVRTFGKVEEVFEWVFG